MKQLDDMINGDIWSAPPEHVIDSSAGTINILPGGLNLVKFRSNETSVISVKVKKLNEDAVIPKYAKPGDAGMDLVAVTKEWDSINRLFMYGTGLAFEIPEGHVGLIFPRSSIYKTNNFLSNSVGVIDSSFRGEVKFMFRTIDGAKSDYYAGDRIGQIIILPYPQVSFEEVEELSETERGTGGFGSTNI